MEKKTLRIDYSKGRQKTLAAVSIFLLVMFYSLVKYEGEVTVFNSWLFVLSSIIALILNVSLLRKIPRSFLGLMTLLFTIVWVGDIFKIFNLPVGDLFLGFRYAFYFPLLGLTFLVLGTPKQGPSKLYLLLVGLILVCQFLIPLVLEPWNQNFPRMIISYLMAAVSFTAVMKYKPKQSTETKIMVLLSLYSILNVIHSIFT